MNFKSSADLYYQNLEVINLRQYQNHLKLQDFKLKGYMEKYVGERECAVIRVRARNVKNERHVFQS